MAEDASLDEFVGSGGDEGGDGEEPPGDATADDAVDAVDDVEGAAGAESARVNPESVAPAVATSRSVPDGTSCPSCGESTTRLWVAEDESVCAACKSW